VKRTPGKGKAAIVPRDKGKAPAVQPVTMTPGNGKTATAAPVTTTPSKGKAAAAPDKAAVAPPPPAATETVPVTPSLHLVTPRTVPAPAPVPAPVLV
jgi:hypothetical protein